MTKQELQKELKEKVKEGVKPSDLRSKLSSFNKGDDLKKLKRSRSADDIPNTPTSVPLKKSQSQLEIPLTQPSSKQQIVQLQEQVKFHAETASNYLKSLQTSQAKVGELEEKLKGNPPNALLTDQLKVKQKEVESLREQGEFANQEIQKLREKLEQTNQELNSLKENHSTLLDDNLSLKHQNLKDWFQQYQQTQKLEQELAENADYASDELIAQDKTISSLQKENNQLKLTNQSLTKDLDLATKLAELRRDNWPTQPTYLPFALYSLMAIAFTWWLVKNQTEIN